MFKLKTLYMQEAGEGGDVGGSPEPANAPNEGWQNDPALDENGNPREEAPAPQPAEEPASEPESDDNEQPNKDESSDPNDSTDNEEEDTSEESYEKLLGTPVVGQVESLLKDAGLDPATVTKDVIGEKGNLTPAAMKALVEKHGDAVASLVASNLSNFYKESQAKVAKRDKAVFDQVATAFKDITDQSGKKSWQELSGWAKENIPNQERKEINKLLQQGGIAAKYAIDDLVSRFKSSNSFVQSAKLETGERAATGGGVKAISQREYNTKFRKLEAEGHVYGQSSELDKLDRQRMAGRKQGI